jgi:hypothetical protein
MCETGVFYTLIQRFDHRLYAKHRAFVHISVFVTLGPDKNVLSRMWCSISSSYSSKRYVPHLAEVGYVALSLIRGRFCDLGFGFILFERFCHYQS